MATFILKHNNSGSSTSGELQYNQSRKTLALGNGSEVIYLLRSGSNSGSLSMEGDISASGNLYVAGNARIVGNLTFGDSDSIDTVTVVASLSSSLIPEGTNVHDLGSTSKYWKNGYITSLTGSLSGSVNGINLSAFSTSLDNRLDIVEATASLYIPFSTSVDSRLDLVEATASYLNTTFSTSVDSRIDSLESNSTNNNSSITALNQHSASINSYTQSNNTNISNLNTISSSYLTFTQSYYTTSASFDSRIDTLESNVVADDTRLDALEIYSASLKTAIELTGSSVTILGDFRVIGTQSVINSENLAVKDNMIYLNDSSSVTNPDLGVVGNYNDGTYRHGGIFRDASDNGVWKVFKGYTPEPSGTIDTSHVSFQLADFYANDISSSTISGIGNVTTYSASVASRLNTTETSNSTQNSRLSNLEIISASYNSYTSSINSYTASNNTNITNLNVISASYLTFTQSYYSNSSSFSSRIEAVNDNLVTTSSFNAYTSSNDTKIGNLNTISSSYLTFTQSYYSDSASFDTRISASTLTHNDTTGQTGIDFTHIGTQVSAVASGLTTTSNVKFANITASNGISASGTVYCDTLVATTLVGATLPVLEYETNGTLGNILIKGATSKSIQVVDTITFEGLSQNGIDQFSATGLIMTGSIKATTSLSASTLVGIGNVTAYSASVDSRLDSVEYSVTTFATTASLTIVSASAWGAFQSASSYSASLSSTINTLSTSVDSRLDALEGGGGFGVSDTTGQTGIDFTKTGTTISAVVSGLTTSSNVTFNNITASGNIIATNDIIAYYSSDERLKDNIQLISNPIEKVQKLRGVEFDWKDGMPKAGRHDYGVIAQDVINVMPELVNQRQDGYYAVDYDKMIGLLIEVVKEQEKRIKDLENKIG